MLCCDVKSSKVPFFFNLVNRDRRDQNTNHKCRRFFCVLPFVISFLSLSAMKQLHLQTTNILKQFFSST